MHKKGWILLLILLCVAFLVSCAKKNQQNPEEMGELVRAETEGVCPFGFVLLEFVRFRIRKFEREVLQLLQCFFLRYRSN